MLLFSTVLNINRNMTRESFVRLVIQWNKTSTYESNIIPDLSWDGSFHARYGDDDRWLAIEEYRPGKIVAVRFEKHEPDGSIWDTDYVMNFADWKMTIRLDRSYEADALGISPRFSTPHFITMMEQKGFLAPDGVLPVSREPFIIDESNLDLLVSVINGTSEFRLPVIYVAKKFSNEDPLDLSRLAGRVKGTAHVLAIQDAELGYALREKCQGKNEFDGAAGIYFPNPSLDHKRYLCHSSEGYDDVQMEKIVRTVIQSGNSLIVEPLYTWQGVNNAILLNRVAAGLTEKANAEAARRQAEQEILELRNTLDEKEQRIRREAAEKAQAEAERILDEFDNDLLRMQKQIETLTQENESLTRENQILKNKLDTSDHLPVLTTGEEEDLYPGEIKDLILTILSEVSSATQTNTRRAHVISDLIENNSFEHITAARAETVKKLLKGYDGMTAPLRHALEDIGFVITEDGKHYKLTYYGDNRYQIIISKTPSDFKTGRNSIQKLNKMVF